MEIATSRLHLREFAPDDGAALDRYRARPEYRRYYDAVPETGPFVAQMLAWAAERPRTRFQLAITRDGVLIGCCGVRLQPDGSAEFGCELDPGHWRQGLAREASEAILDFAVRELGVEEIRAHCNPRNEAAQRLAAGLGFVPADERGGELLLSRR